MRWLVMLFTGAFLITVWAHMPEDADSEPNAVSARRAAEVRYGRTLRALERAESEYRERARADSLLPLLPAAPGLVVALAPLVPPGTAASIDATLARELGDIGAPRARIGVFVLDAAYGRRSAFARMRLNTEREMYTGTDAAGPYCTSVSTGFVRDDNAFVTPAFGFATNRHWTPDDVAVSVLGPCAFMARYGAPGPRIAEWLDRGAWRFGELRGYAAVPDTARPLLRRWSGYDYNSAIRGCGAGRDDLCRSFFFLSDADQGNEGAGLDLSVFAIRNPPAGLLHDLERQFGPDPFARFWTSRADPEIAFATAFGTDAITWTRAWARSHYRFASIGPLMDAGNMLLSVLAAVVLAGAGVLVARWREA